MNYSLQDVIKLIADLRFPSKFNRYNHADVFAELQEKLGDDIYIDSGVSKAVLLIKGLNKVVKIPFNSIFDEDSYDEAIKCEEVCEDPKIEDFMFDFEYANTDNKALTSSWDYCALESCIYELAEEEGLELYFAEEYRYNAKLPWRIYIQTRCEMLEEDDRYSDQELSKISTYCTKNNLFCFNRYWIADFISAYGEEEFKRLSDFLTKYRIKDLHGGNLGYLDGLPVLVDYSCYREW